MKCDVLPQVLIVCFPDCVLTSQSSRLYVLVKGSMVWKVYCTLQSGKWKEKYRNIINLLHDGGPGTTERWASETTHRHKQLLYCIQIPLLPNFSQVVKQISDIVSMCVRLTQTVATAVYWLNYMIIAECLHMCDILYAKMYEGLRRCLE